LKFVIKNKNSLKEIDFKITRNSHFDGKIIFIDGLPGCGKTLFSSLVTAFERVEKITYSYEIEHLCAIHQLKRAESDSVVAMVRMLTDLIVYDMMMSRNVNCRPSDLSSIFRHPDKLKYIKRFFSKGDMAVPARVIKEKPILPITVHNLLSVASPIFKALGERVVYIEIVRHPLYMIIQQALNNELMVFNVRDFTIYYEYQQKEMPWYTLGWEQQFLNANYVEKAVLFIEKVGGMMDNSRNEMNKEYPGRILTIPFEKFVTNPDIYMNQMESLMDSRITKSTSKMLRKQNVPRKKVSEGIPLEIYKRCGWVPPKAGLSERGEFEVRRKFAFENVSPEILKTLDRLCTEYEEKYLGGVIIGKDGYKD
jgi:hypothetical protein